MLFLLSLLVFVIVVRVVVFLSNKDKVMGNHINSFPAIGMCCRHASLLSLFCFCHCVAIVIVLFSVVVVVFFLL